MALADKKFLGGASSNVDFFSNEEKWVRVEYDFANDTGATADYDVLANGSTTKSYVLTDFYSYVETAVLPATTVVMDLGISDGGTEIWSDKASSALTLGAVVGMDTAAPIKLAASGKFVLGIESQAVTAGKLHFYFKLKQINTAE